MTDTSDFSCVNDVDANLSTVDGRLALAQSLARRLTTPRGQCFYWPEYGLDLSGYVNSKTDPNAIASLARAEILSDERVEDASVSVEVTERNLAMRIVVQDQDGSLVFTLTIDEAAESLVELQEQYG